MRKILTIAGSDTSGGAGMQADLRTFAKHDLYGMTVLTTIVAMDPKDWGHYVFPIGLDVIERQLDTAFALGVNAIKTGMLPTVDIIQVVAKRFDKVLGSVPIVIDPVMVCKGTKPMFPEHAEFIKNVLVEYATVTTPNLFEAAQLVGAESIDSFDDATEAAKQIVSLGAKAVMIKGVGKLYDEPTADDLFYDGEKFKLLKGEMIDTTYIHGLGCTLSAHVASNLCKGLSALEACKKAKKAVAKGLKHAFQLQQEHGTLDFTKSFK